MFPFVALGWVGWALTALFITQLVIALVTVYFHRVSSHRAVTFSPGLHRVCRFLSWFLIAMVPQEFAAVHRKHHAKCDTDEDPHSPVKYGWHGVLFGGLGLYRRESSNPQTIAQYGQGLPVDPWESFYKKHKNLGILLFAFSLVTLFGFKGLLLWAVCMLWIPFWAAGVVNGLGHHVGYRRFQTEDLSTNLWSWGIWIGGEELHNNHHAYPSSPKFSHAWYEVDLGWGWIRLLESLGWAKAKTPVVAPGDNTFGELLRERYEHLRQFQASLSDDLAQPLRAHGFKDWRHLSRVADRSRSLKKHLRVRLDAALDHPALAEAHRLELSLRDLWQTRRAEAGQARKAMEEWLGEARSKAWPSLARFCDGLAPPAMTTG